MTYETRLAVALGEYSEIEDLGAYADSLRLEVTYELDEDDYLPQLTIRGKSKPALVIGIQEPEDEEDELWFVRKTDSQNEWLAGNYTMTAASIERHFA